MAKRGFARAAALCVAVSGALAGCAAPKPPAIVLSTPTPPPAGIDGRYRGTVRLIRSESRFCPHSGPRVLELQNGSVTLSYQGPGRARISLTAPVQGNGDFDASDGEGRLQGHVAGGQLEMTVASSFCEHHWIMRQID